MPAGVQVASLFAAIGADLSGLGRGLKEAQGKLKKAGQSIAGLGTKLTMGVTLPIVGIGVAAVKMAGDFEEQMGLLGIAAKAAGEEMDTIREFALKMGADTIYNAREMADAMTGLYKAGMTSADVMGDLTGETGALAAAVQLATASDLELAQAADAIAVAMATFGLNAEDAVAITNNFVQAADASVAEVSGLVAAFQNVGPTAAQFGWTLEDVNTALAILSERGIRGSEAGTALKSMMTNLMRPTDEVQATLKELNIQLYDADGAMKTLPSIIQSLSRALYGQVEATREVGGRTREQNDELKRLGKTQASLTKRVRDYEAGIKGVNLSEEKRAEKLAELRTALHNTRLAMLPLEAIQGDMITTTHVLTEEQRNQAIQTLAGTYGMKAMNTLLAEGMEGWEGMTGSISEAATAQDVANVKMNSLSGVLETLSGSLETVGIKVGTALLPPLQELLTDHVIPLIDRIGELDPATIKWGLAIAGVAAAVGPALIVLGNLVKVFALLTTPLGLIGLALAALGVAYTTNFLGFRDAVDALLPKIIAFGEAAKLWLGENIPKAMQALSDFWNETLRPALLGIWAWLGIFIPQVLEILSELWTNTLLPAIEGVWEFIDHYMIPLFEALAKVGEATLGLAITALTGIWENELQPALETAWEFIEENVIPILKDLAEYAEVIAGGALIVLQGIIDTLKGALEGLKGAIDSVVGWLDDLAEKISSFNLPWWLRPGSATPLEKGLLGISKAARDAARAMRDLDRAQPGDIGLGGFPGAPGGAGAGVGGQPLILAPVFIDPRDFQGPTGDVDYALLGDYLLRERLS